MNGSTSDPTRSNQASGMCDGSAAKLAAALRDMGHDVVDRTVLRLFGDAGSAATQTKPVPVAWETASEPATAATLRTAQAA
jgi:hypothetical protein